MTSRLPESDWYTAAEAAITAIYALHPTPQACISSRCLHYPLNAYSVCKHRIVQDVFRLFLATAWSAQHCPESRRRPCSIVQPASWTCWHGTKRNAYIDCTAVLTCSPTPPAGHHDRGGALVRQGGAPRGRCHGDRCRCRGLAAARRRSGVCTSAGRSGRAAQPSVLRRGPGRLAAFGALQSDMTNVLQLNRGAPVGSSKHWCRLHDCFVCLSNAT